MNSLLSPKFTVICALFQPGDEEASETFWLQSAPRRGGMGIMEVNSSQKGTERASKATDTSYSTGRFQVRGFFSYLSVYCGDEAQTSTLGDLPTLEQPHLVAPAVGWKSYCVCSKDLFQPKFGRDSVVLLCLKLSLQFLTDHFTGYFLKSENFVIDFIIKKIKKINHQKRKCLSFFKKR